MKTYISSPFILYFLLIGVYVQTCFGTDYQQIRTMPQDVAPAKLESCGNNLVFTGIVKEISGGVAVLITASKTYILGGGNFKGIVGREVNIIGRVIAEGSFEKIIVSHIQLARQ